VKTAPEALSLAEAVFSSETKFSWAERMGCKRGATRSWAKLHREKYLAFGCRHAIELFLRPSSEVADELDNRAFSHRVCHGRILEPTEALKKRCKYCVRIAASSLKAAMQIDPRTDGMLFAFLLSFVLARH
jgi:hypothetical protein